LRHDRVAITFEGRFHQVQQPLCKQRQVAGIITARTNHGKLVAAKPVNADARTQTGKPAPDFADQAIPHGMPHAVIYLLEIVHVEQEQAEPALLNAHGLSDFLVECITVGQACELIVVGKVLQLAADFRPFHGDRTEVDTGVDQLALHVARSARFAVVECKGANHPALGGFDRAGPAGLQPQREHKISEAVPAEIRLDINNFNRHTEMGGGAAGTDLRPDGNAIDRLAIGLRQAGPGHRMDQAFAVDRRDRADRTGSKSLGTLAQYICNAAEIRARGNGLQYLVLQCRQFEAESGLHELFLHVHPGHRSKS
jgi:hypothetical protein